MTNTSAFKDTQWLRVRSVPDGMRDWWVMVSLNYLPNPKSEVAPRVRLDLERAASSGRGASEVKHEACREWMGTRLMCCDGVIEHWSGVWSLPGPAEYAALLETLAQETEVSVVPRWSRQYLVRYREDVFHLHAVGDGKRCMEARRPASHIRLGIELPDVDVLADDYEAVAQARTARLSAWLTHHVDLARGASHPHHGQWWIPNEDAFWDVLSGLLGESQIEPLGD